MNTNRKFTNIIAFFFFCCLFSSVFAQVCTGPMTVAVPGSTTALPLAVLASNVVDESCSGAADGSISVTMAGGSPSYVYSWYDIGVNAANRNGLSAGTYTVKVSDANACFSVQTYTVAVPSPMLATAANNGIPCFGGTTDISVTVTGGTAPYQYQLGTGAFQSSNIFNVPAGAYTITVKDAHNCTTTCTSNVSVIDATPPVIAGCPSNISLTALGGLCNTPVTWTAPTATDNCSVVNVTSSHNSGDIFPIGTTIVSYTFTDGNSNSSTCSFSVTVNSAAMNILAVANTNLHANAECTDAAGWTHYYHTTSNTILLSVYKNGVSNLGTIGDPTFDVMTATTLGYGSNTAINITNPPALYVSNQSWFVMNRYWNLAPVNQLTNTPVRVRYYFTTQDKNDIDGSLPGALTINQIKFYKINGSIYNPNPALGHAGIPAAPTRDANGYVQYYNNPSATVPTGLEWVLGAYGTGYYAEYEVDRFSGGGGGGSPTSGGAFPIELLDFTGHKEGMDHVLDWHTTKETGSSYFEVQRLTNSTGTYERIGIVNAAGNSDVVTAYTFTDYAPLVGRNVYRLKQVDIDGSFSYSHNVELMHEVGAFFDVYPNPFNQTLQVKVDGITKGITLFELYDETGKVIISEKWTITGAATKVMDVSNLADGIYFYKIQNGSKELTGKAIKSR